MNSNWRRRKHYRRPRREPRFAFKPKESARLAATGRCSGMMVSPRHIKSAETKLQIPSRTLSLPTTNRPRLAAVVTEYRKFFHAQHIVDRFLFGYGWEGRHHRPEADIVALYVDQRPASDLSRSCCRVSPDAAGSDDRPRRLTDGGRTLSVDGILLIGEHGTYPRTKRGRPFIRRYEFFRADHRCVPQKRAKRSDLQRQTSLVELGPRRARWSQRRQHLASH